jgi:hypothetical protein
LIYSKFVGHLSSDRVSLDLTTLSLVSLLVCSFMCLLDSIYSVITSLILLWLVGCIHWSVLFLISQSFPCVQGCTFSCAVLYQWFAPTISVVVQVILIVSTYCTSSSYLLYHYQRLYKSQFALKMLPQHNFSLEYFFWK